MIDNKFFSNNSLLIYIIFGSIFFLTLLLASIFTNDWYYLLAFSLSFPFSFFSFFLLNTFITKVSTNIKQKGRISFFIVLFLFRTTILICPLIICIILSNFYDLSKLTNIWIIAFGLLSIPIINFIINVYFLIKNKKKVNLCIVK